MVIDGDNVVERVRPVIPNGGALAPGEVDVRFEPGCGSAEVRGPPRVPWDSVLLAVAAALALCPVASADGAAKGRGFVSRVQAIRPAVPGLSARVLGGDHELELRNETGENVLVLGYAGEPYLRIEPRGVFRNTRSRATYLNEDRFGQTPPQKGASPTAMPRWERLTGANEWRWHDHRIHWMSRIDPPQVRADPDSPHEVFTWQVPTRVGDRHVVVAGELDYEPVDVGGRAWLYLAAPLAGLLALGVWLTTKRRRMPASP